MTQDTAAASNKCKVVLVITDSATTLSPLFQDAAARTVDTRVFITPDIEPMEPKNRAARRGNRHGKDYWNKNRNKRGGKR